MSDLIERAAALDALAVYIHNVDKVYSTGLMSADDCKDAAHSVLDDLPSAQPQRMRGRWIKSETDGFLCSVCHIGYKTQPTLMGNPMFEFCPCCGADMMGTE